MSQAVDDGVKEGLLLLLEAMICWGTLAASIGFALTHELSPAEQVAAVLICLAVGGYIFAVTERKFKALKKLIFSEPEEPAKDKLATT